MQNNVLFLFIYLFKMKSYIKVHKQKFKKYKKTTKKYTLKIPLYIFILLTKNIRLKS